MRRELREWGWMALGFSACLLIAGIGVVVWGNHIEHRIDRVVIERHRDHRALRRVTAALGDGREVQANSKRAKNSEDGSSGGPTRRSEEPSGGTEGGSISPPVSGPKPQKPPPQVKSPPAEADTGTDNLPAEAETTASTPPPEVDQGGGQETSLAKPVFEDIGSIAEQVGETADHVLCPVNALGIHVCTE